MYIGLLWSSLDGARHIRECSYTPCMHYGNYILYNHHVTDYYVLCSRNTITSNITIIQNIMHTWDMITSEWHDCYVWYNAYTGHDLGSALDVA